MYNGKRYHDKTIRTKYKGELKKLIFKNKSKKLNAIAITKYKRMGKRSARSSPAIRMIIDLIPTIDKPLKAVPTVKFATTY